MSAFQGISEVHEAGASMSEGDPTRACDLCGDEPLSKSALCLRCHRALVGESVKGKALKPPAVTVRAPGEKKAAS